MMKKEQDHEKKDLDQDFEISKEEDKKNEKEEYPEFNDEEYEEYKEYEEYPNVRYAKEQDEKKIRKINQRVDKDRMKIRDSDDRKLADGVFDKKLRETLRNLMRKGILDDILGVISTGKEANIYYGVGVNEEEYAIKIYRDTASTFRRIKPYIEGDRRFQKIRNNYQEMVAAWCQKEFKNLSRLYANDIRAPQPIARIDNLLVMEFIGEDGREAPLLKDVEPEKIEKPTETYITILRMITKMVLEANLVHGDLSEYNILFWEQQPYFIDVGQSVLLSHPQSSTFLLRDIRNINAFFETLSVEIRNEERIFQALAQKIDSEDLRLDRALLGLHV
ncbi:MAG: serine protein kinase RIO [Candidatus Kariarchaeaceae archaeon]